MIQVPPGPHLWPRYNLKVWRKCLCYEEACGSGLRGHSAGWCLPPLRQNSAAEMQCSPPSVGSPSSRAYCQAITTRSCLTSPLIWPHGTPTQNFACTQLTLSSPYGRKQRNLVANSVVTPANCVPSIRQNRCQERLPPLIATRLRRERSPLQLPIRLTHWGQNQRPVMARASSSSTSRPTRSMRLATMQTTLGGSAQPIAFRHNRSVPSPLNPPPPHHALSVE